MNEHTGDIGEHIETEVDAIGRVECWGDAEYIPQEMSKTIKEIAHRNRAVVEFNSEGHTDSMRPTEQHTEDPEVSK